MLDLYELVFRSQLMESFSATQFREDIKVLENVQIYQGFTLLRTSLLSELKNILVPHIRIMKFKG